MSISISTHGILWPRATVIRDVATAFEAEVSAESSLSAQVSSGLDLSVEVVTESSLRVEVEVVDGITSTLGDSHIDGDLG